MIIQPSGFKKIKKNTAQQIYETEKCYVILRLIFY